jgi:hypothetical protein
MRVTLEQYTGNVDPALEGGVVERAERDSAGQARNEVKKGDKKTYVSPRLFVAFTSVPASRSALTAFIVSSFSVTRVRQDQ